MALRSQAESYNPHAWKNIDSLLKEKLRPWRVLAYARRRINDLSHG